VTNSSLSSYQSSDRLVDTHCHIDFDAFDNDRDAVLQDAAVHGVAAVINPAINLDNSRKIVSAARNNQGLFAAVGVHPNDGASWNDDTEGDLRTLGLSERVVAIGEIGLDYYWKTVDPVLQKHILITQLGIAADLNLPVIIHNRNATQDIISVLHNWISAIKSQSVSVPYPPGVLHSFSANVDDAKRVIEMGFMIGIGGPITFRNAHTLAEVVRNVSLEDIVIETDAPFLSPHPFRGQRNDPGKVRLVAAKIAEIQGLSYSEVCRQTTENAVRLFRGKVRINHG